MRAPTPDASNARIAGLSSAGKGCLHGVGRPSGLVDVGVDGLHGADHVHAVLVVHRVGLRVLCASMRYVQARTWELVLSSCYRDRHSERHAEREQRKREGERRREEGSGREGRGEGPVGT